MPLQNPKEKQRPAPKSASMNPLVYLALVPAAGIAAFATMYRVAKPSEYLVRTGLFIDANMGMSVSRKCLLIPGQNMKRVRMTPRNLNFTLKCLSQQYLPFKMPVTYTVTPFDPVVTQPFYEKDSKGEMVEVESQDLFKRYVQKMDHLDQEHFDTTILGVIHGETRVLAARMSIDAINDDRDAFRDEVVNRVQQILMPYGVKVDNANIAELIEDPREGQMGYLQARERKKLSSAVQESEIDVAEAEQMGDIGKKKREAKTRQELARLEAETRMYEFETQQKVAQSAASLAEVQAESRRREEVAAVAATAAAAQKKEELQKMVEEARQEQEMAAKKAHQLTSAKVTAECAIAEAEGIRQAAEIEAAGKARAIEIMAAAIQKEGEAKAAALLADLMAKADGERAMLDAQAQGTSNLVNACGGNPQLLEPVLMIYNNIPQKVAEEGARAVQGLNPQIWAMSGDDAGSSVARMVGGMAPAIDMFKKHVSPETMAALHSTAAAGASKVVDVKTDSEKN